MTLGGWIAVAAVLALLIGLWLMLAGRGKAALRTDEHSSSASCMLKDHQKPQIMMGEPLECSRGSCALPY